MPYPEIMIRPMREELTRLGVEELKTPEAVDETLQNSKGTVMVVVNSICGCAAGKARPGVALALQNAAKHAPEARVRVAIRPESGRLVLTVTDDGPGFDAADRAGVGIHNMADRLASLGGSFEVISTPGGGTTVRGTVPIGGDGPRVAVAR